MTALETVYDSIVSCFAADAPPSVDVRWGWREVTKFPTGGPTFRVVVVPGNYRIGSSTADAGAVGPPFEISRAQRQIGRLAEIGTVFCWAIEKSNAEVERLQYAQCRSLFNATYRAIYRAARGRFAVKSVEWHSAQVERRHGMAIRSVITVDDPLLDVPLDGTSPWLDVHPWVADNTAEMLDHSEKVTQ